MELRKVTDSIEQCIADIKTGLKQLKPRAKRKAQTIARYEKELAKIIIRLRNGDEIELDNEWIKDPPVTVIEKIARGICFQEKLDMELADAEYKNAVAGLDAIKAELNGFQSINRYQSEH